MLSKYMTCQHQGLGLGFRISPKLDASSQPISVKHTDVLALLATPLYTVYTFAGVSSESWGPDYWDSQHLDNQNVWLCLIHRQQHS